ncbi:MAG: hypothetical protein IPI42_16505 [Saprospiraceae bacterium]|nr:hypothetical protein [Candidatus Parvibacillus calidus]
MTQPTFLMDVSVSEIYMVLGYSSSQSQVKMAFINVTTGTTDISASEFRYSTATVCR